jgi:hypothetical protein
LPFERIGCSAQPVRAPGEQHVHRGDRDVQVLGVGDEHAETEHHRELEQDERGLQGLVRGQAERVQPVPDDLRGESAVRVGENAGVDLRAAVDQQRRDDQEDQEQHEPGRAGVRAGEARFAALALRVGPQPDDRERGDAHQH